MYRFWMDEVEDWNREGSFEEVYSGLWNPGRVFSSAAHELG